MLFWTPLSFPLTSHVRTGTGKTETTKDLSAQLGKSVYVFNCAPEMDFRTMGDIFKGLAASGSWGCFDEFNRLVPEVLSVCSVQYKCVTDSQKRKTMLPGRGLEYIDKDGVKHTEVEGWKFVAADGVEMPLEEGTSAFITMNPGYGMGIGMRVECGMWVG